MTKIDLVFNYNNISLENSFGQGFKKLSRNAWHRTTGCSILVYKGIRRVPQGVFGQRFHPLVFESFSKFTTKRAKMTLKEKK